MQRIMIVGGPGSGKSTLARWIGKQTGLPVQHMDLIHWQAGWIERSQCEKLALISAVEMQERWVIEGGVSKRYAQRLERADVMIWLDLPIGLRLWRVFWRSVRYRGQARPDLPEGCPEQLGVETLKFLWWCWNNRITGRLKVERTLAAYKGHAEIHRLSSPRDVAVFQAAFEERLSPTSAATADL